MTDTEQPLTMTDLAEEFMTTCHETAVVNGIDPGHTYQVTLDLVLRQFIYAHDGCPHCLLRAVQTTVDDVLTEDPDLKEKFDIEMEGDDMEH